MLAHDTRHIKREFVLAQPLRQIVLQAVTKVLDLGILQKNLHDIGVLCLLWQLHQGLRQHFVEGLQRLFRFGIKVSRDAFPHRTDVDAISHAEHAGLGIKTLHREIIGKAGFRLEQIAVIPLSQG